MRKTTPILCEPMLPSPTTSNVAIRLSDITVRNTELGPFEMKSAKVLLRKEGKYLVLYPKVY